jgi:hypothetical protein
MTDFDHRSSADYQAARLKATIGKILGLLRRQRRELLSFGEVQNKLRLGGPVYQGVQSVPISKIVGSVDRYRDFDRLYLPTQSHTEDRWRRIARAWYKDISLPPVVLYKVGEVYFVIDGNHRVSVAREKGQEFIDAEVREVKSKVPVTPSITADDLERLGSQVEFFERTDIDRILPGVSIESTILGGYDRLIEHIAVHRYFMGMERGEEVSTEEAVQHWYETIYRPVVGVVEESLILEEFKDRTASDLYLWVMDHLHFLLSRPDVDAVAPSQSAENFVDTLGEGDGKEGISNG